MAKLWSPSFLESHQTSTVTRKTALIILNQPFSLRLLERLFNSARWVACADGGANRLFDVANNEATRQKYFPDLIKGDLDSLRQDVKQYYASRNVKIEYDADQDSTDLMKCVSSLRDKEALEEEQYDLIILGGLSGRLDQTVHTLSFVHKLRKSRERVFVVTDENVSWVLDSGEHEIEINHTLLGPTCGLLPLGVKSTILSTGGLRWNLTEQESSFDGLVSTSNHLVPGETTVYINTTKPIWWTVELRHIPN